MKTLCGNKECRGFNPERTGNCIVYLPEEYCPAHEPLTAKTPGGAKLACCDGLSDLRTDFAKGAIKDAKNKIDWRIQAYEEGGSALTAEQYEDYKHDAYLLFKAQGR